MAKASGRAVRRSVRFVPMPTWLFMKGARMSGYPIDLFRGIRYYIEDHERGAFELGAPTTDVLDVTSRPPRGLRDDRSSLCHAAPQPADSCQLASRVRTVQHRPA